MDGLRASLFTTLNGDSQLTDMLATTTSIYHRRAPLNAVFPYVVFDIQSGTSVWTFKGPPFSNQIWMIKGIDKSSSASVAEDIDKRIATILTDPVMTLSDGALLYMHRESDINYGEETDPDYIIHHAGGSYRIIIDRTV